MGVLIVFFTGPLIGLLIINETGLGSPGPMGVDFICNVVRYASLLVSKHFSTMHFTNPTGTLQPSTHSSVCRIP